jgi:hypothetical protein
MKDIVQKIDEAVSRKPINEASESDMLKEWKERWNEAVDRILDEIPDRIYDLITDIDCWDDGKEEKAALKYIKSKVENKLFPK